MKKQQEVPRPEWMTRPQFREHQRLSAERLNRVIEGHVARLRHALLGLAGPGVIYGYAMQVGSDNCAGELHVGPGLAVDRYGRQLFWPGGVLRLHQLAGGQPREPGPYLLLAHYAELEQDIEDCSWGPSSVEWVREGVVFSLVKPGQVRTRNCPALTDPEHMDVIKYVCGRNGGANSGVEVDGDLRRLTEEPAALSCIGPDGWLYDAEAGLPLGQVTIAPTPAERTECFGEFAFGTTTPEVCEYRQHVVRNPLLLELLRGCHVEPARVESLSFSAWLREDCSEVPWPDFAEVMHQGITVRFTKPVKLSSLSSSSIFLTALVREHESSFQDVIRIPMQEMRPVDGDTELVREVHICFSEHWIHHQIEDEISRFGHGAIIEFTIRGAMVRDGANRMLDARPLGFEAPQPSLATLGNDFVVAFHVAQRQPRTHRRYGGPSPSSPL